MKLKRNVVMLPTNKKASTNGLVINPFTNKIEYNDIVNKKGAKYYTDVAFTYNHIYITSDEEIKVGDWYYTPSKRSIEQCVAKILIIKGGENDVKQLKIIATTDKSLTISEIIYPEEFVHVMPSPSDGFIKKFIERYNAGNPITEVMVEYEEYPITTYGMSDGEPETDTRLKVDKNNCITIRSVKESWTREEVITILHSYLDSFSTKSEKFHKILEDQMNEWIEQNL